jgi:transcription termination factor Rho
MMSTFPLCKSASWARGPARRCGGKFRPPREGEQALALTQVETVNGQVPTHVAQRLFFEDHTPLRPNHSESLLA